MLSAIRDFFSITAPRTIGIGAVFDRIALATKFNFLSTMTVMLTVCRATGRYAGSAST